MLNGFEGQALMCNRSKNRERSMSRAHPGPIWRHKTTSALLTTSFSEMLAAPRSCVPSQESIEWSRYESERAVMSDRT